MCYQGATATAELAALVHGVAGLLGLLLTPDAPPAAEAQRSIDRLAAALPVLIHVEALLRQQGRLSAKAGQSGHQRHKVSTHAFT
jgi:phytoene/squalene synthetase